MSRPLQGRPLSLSPAQQRQLREWASFGRNVSQVAQRFGVAPRTVFRYLRDINKGTRETA